MGFLAIEGVVLAIGIPGLVAFASHDSMAQPVIAAKLLRIAGDGTSRMLDAMVWLIGIAGYFGAMYQWHRWGQMQQLPRAYVGLLQLVVILLIVTVVHEFGHAVVGSALGMKLRAFIVGPFQWRIRDGKWKFQFLPAKFLSAGGATALVPTNPHQSLGSQICMIAAGPTVNLLTGLIALCAALTAKGQPYEPYWGFFAYFSTISLLVFASNLIPMQSEASYSDGGRIYQLLSGGPLADLYRVMNLVGSTLVTPLRPRDYDIDAIQRAEISFTQGMQALLLRLFASSYFLDHRMIPQAAQAVSEAERIQKESALDLPAELCMAFVYRTAFLRRDAASARQWWERMEAKKPTHFGVDYWLAQSALFWIEGRKEEARVAWNKGNVLAQQLPAAGDCEFDRHRSALLHDCIENEAANAAS
jgi:Zn-dependent protease